MGYITSGNQIVDAMGMMNISGNVIPQIWYSTITRPNGKPYLLAITLLSDIVYWYRPAEERDEQCGRVIGWKKRFKGDLLQKTYQQYADLYGESKRSIKAALDRLEELGVIKKEFYYVPCENGMVLYNLMYIALNAEVLHQLTYPEEVTEEMQETSEEVGGTEDCNIYLQNNAGGGTKFCRGYDKMMYEGVQNDVRGGTAESTTVLQENVPPHTMICGTNTETNTQITDRDYINPINQGNAPVQKGMDEMDMIAAYTQIIKSNIEYDALKLEMGYQGALVDEIVELLVETVSVKREHIRISGADYPYQLVKGKLLKLDYTHIRYVMDCMQKNTTKVANIRAYLLTALYNAPNTIDSYYQAEVNHDMYGGGCANGNY